MSLRSALLMSAGLLLGGCNVTTQLGVPCELVRAATPQERENGGLKFVPIYEKELVRGQDFISFGAVQCDDLICVRDASVAPSDNPEDVALGYCSKECIEGTTTGCEVTDSSVAQDLKDRMACRALLLDQATLDALRAADPDYYRATFGENTSPFFCAGRAPAAQGN